MPNPAPPPSPPTNPIDLTLLPPSSHRKRAPKHPNLSRLLRSVFLSLPSCRFPSPLPGHIHGAHRTTGTLFGRRKSRISLAVQETPRGIPILLLELPIQTARFMQDMGTGLMRVALECEKRPGERTRLLEEKLWSAFANGRRIGYAQRREPSQTDLKVLQLLRAVSMGAGVLPLNGGGEASDGEMAYMRAHFDRAVGSRDSETFYMLNPEGNTGPELSVFFVRL